MCDDGDPGGQVLLAEALRVALAAGETEDAARAYVNTAWTLMADRRLEAADDVLAAAIAHADRAEYVGFLDYLQAELGMLRLLQGRWEEAVVAAGDGADASAPVRCPALVVLGLVRVRRGEPGGDALLDKAWELAVRSQEPQRLGPAAAARAEAAWLRGDADGVRRAVAGALDAVAGCGSHAVRAELSLWADDAGRLALRPPADHPHALLGAGRWAEAAAAWAAAGMPYEQALALARSPEAADRLAALAILDGLGAEPAARLIRSGLRDLGVARIPRGPQVTTRANPAGLTGRQLEILRLIAEGLTNQEIADRLVLSVRTVDNHVSAVLEKLSVPSRREAAAKAEELGVVG
jgi:DNA-binding CsgD family transcriptional regulator